MAAGGRRGRHRGCGRRARRARRGSDARASSAAGWRRSRWASRSRRSSRRRRSGRRPSSRPPSTASSPAPGRTTCPAARGGSAAARGGGTFGGRGNFGGPPPGTRPSGSFAPAGGRHASRRRHARRAGFGGGATSSASITAALKYVESHGATKRFGLIVQNEQEAATAVIAGEPVASLGGFTGRETVLTNSYLARLISRHEARYFLLGGQSGVGGPGRDEQRGRLDDHVDLQGGVDHVVSSASSGGSARSTTVPARPKRLQALVDARGGRELLTQLGQFSLVGSPTRQSASWCSRRCGGPQPPPQPPRRLHRRRPERLLVERAVDVRGGGRRRSLVRYGVVRVRVPG